MAILDDVSETAWKWRCKIGSAIKNQDRTAADFATESLSIQSDMSDDIDKKAVQQAGKKAAKAAKAAAASKSHALPPGSSPVVKTMYEGPNSYANNYNWVDYPPKQLSKSEATAQSQVAIKAYMIKDLSKPVISGRATLKYHMVTIQNPTLIAALNDALKDQDIHLDVEEIATFKAPFQSLYFGYDNIVAKYNSMENGSPLRPFMLLLIRLLDEILAETRQKLKYLRSNGLVSYRLAWTYFPRGTIVVSYQNGETLCKVVRTSYQSTSCGEVMAVHGQIVQFDGEAFVWQDIDLEIPAFGGNKPMVELSCYPLEYHKDPEGVKGKLIARGKKVLDLQGLAHCNYNGIAISEGKHNVNCRILVDVIGYNKHKRAKGAREKDSPEYWKNIISGRGDAEEREALMKEKEDSEGPMATEEQSHKEEKTKTATVSRLTEEEQARIKQKMLSEETNLMFLSPVIEGYSLKNKLWMFFFIDDIHPIAWNMEAYDHLVYDEQQKDLVLSFVENHGSSKPVMTDVIVGKGEGLVVLLSGPPGTGKTLTAEAVADRTHRPLFYLHAEDLGITANTLGSKLKKVLEMATEWDAVVLLDEADVFMAERDPHNIARNELVSIFLRELEYFRGIIFLTTNLYSTIDGAFRSRVSLHLLFPPLTPQARTVVWKKFLDRLTPAAGKGKQIEDTQNSAAGLVEEDIEELAAWNLNGREIKNAVKMVKSWCDYKNYEMTVSRLENGIKVTSPHASKHGSETDTSLYDN